MVTKGPSGSSLPSYEELQKDHAFLYAEYSRLKREHESLKESLIDAHGTIDSIVTKVYEAAKKARIESTNVVHQMLEGAYGSDS